MLSRDLTLRKANMIPPLKPISIESIPAALHKAAHYRLLNQPDQAESIARDVLLASPGHKGACRELGLALTDQFAEWSERFTEAEQLFRGIDDPYETPYLLGLLHERLCRALLARHAPAERLAHLIAEALRLYAEAEPHRPPGNDDALLRWNSLVRLLTQHPHLAPAVEHEEHLDLGDGPPV